MFAKMSENDMITGGGHWMNDDQRKDSKYQPYKLLRDDGQGGYDYRLAEPYRIPMAIIADIQKWKQYKKEGRLTEDQLDFSAMLARIVRGVVQDSPLTGPVKNWMKLFGVSTSEETRLEVGTEILAGAVPTVPNFIKSARRNEQVYVDDRAQTKDFGDRIWQNLSATPAINLKRDEYGRPKERNETSTVNYLFRAAGQNFPSSELREYKLDQILEADNRFANIIGPISDTYDGHDMKEYWNDEGRTIYEDFQIFLQTNENSKGLTMMEESLEIIEDPDWKELYNDGILGSLHKADPIELVDDAYDASGSLIKAGKEKSNAGLEKLRDAKRATVEEAKTAFFKQERLEKYRNREGETPAEALISHQKAAQR